MKFSSQNNLNSHLWKISLACFLIAALTGFLYRLGVAGWLPANLELNLGNIRHAHSHLMFFGWAVPFPLLILITYLRKNGAKTAGMIYSVAGILAFGLATFPFFLIYGYRPVEIGAAVIPAAAALSGLVMICWYFFIWGYRKARVKLEDNISRPWFDGALALLLISSLGAWGVSGVQGADPSGYLLAKIMTRFFLAVFTEGWVVLAITAILVMELKPGDHDWPIFPNFFLSCIVIGAPLTFPYGISEYLLTPGLLTTARIGGGLVAIGLGGVVYALYSSAQSKPNKWIWIWSIIFLGIKAAIQLFVSVNPFFFGLSNYGLHILYLHVLLLGALTLTITGWLHVRIAVPDNYFYGIAASVFIVLISLILPTALWPGEWSGSWIFSALAAAALLPALAVSGEWIKLAISKKTDARYTKR